MRAAELGFGPDSVTCLREKEDAVTWRCVRGRRSAILKCYRAQNAALDPGQRCRKSELAGAELRPAGIPTPRVLAASPETAMLLVEDVGPGAWRDGAHTDAAMVLRRLHELAPSVLSVELADLVAATEPNRHRVALGMRMLAARLDADASTWRAHAPAMAAQADAIAAADEPWPAADECRLVHGDYFRANLIATASGVQVIDWDLFGLGDPVWDVAFLVGAEPAVPPAAQAAALAAYGPLGPAAAERLEWHTRCWQTFWALRRLSP